MPIKVHFKINYISAEMCTLLCFTIQDLDISCSVVPLHRFQLAIFLLGNENSTQHRQTSEHQAPSSQLDFQPNHTATPYSEAKLTLVDRGVWAYQISPNNVILPQSKVINSFCQVACRAVWSYSWHNRNSKTNWSISWPLALAWHSDHTLCEAQLLTR